MIKKMRAGVLGLMMGEGHCIGYRDNKYCELVALCDPDAELLAKRAETYKTQINTTDWREIVDNPDIDIISVASPDYFHAEQAIAALRNGKHVMCEKPMTLSMDEAKAIIAEVEKGKAKFMIGQVCRYAPAFALAKKLISEGMIGDLYFVESEYAHDYGVAPGANNWRVDPRREPMIGGGCHAVDLLRWIAGDAITVSAFANHKCLTEWPVNDCTVAIFNFPNNVIGKVMCSIGCTRPYTMRSAFYGTQGTIICDNTSPEIKVCSKKLMHDKLDFASLPVRVANHDIAAEIDEFTDCIVNNKPVLTDVYEGAKTVATAMAAVESAKSGGKPVNVADILA